MTASSFGFFFRGVARPFDFGSNLSSSGTIPTALLAPGAGGMPNYNLTPAVMNLVSLALQAAVWIFRKRKISRRF
jgi:hypothetical protein